MLRLIGFMLSSMLVAGGAVAVTAGVVGLFRRVARGALAAVAGGLGFLALLLAGLAFDQHSALAGAAAFGFAVSAVVAWRLRPRTDLRPTAPVDRSSAAADLPAAANIDAAFGRLLPALDWLEVGRMERARRTLAAFLAERSGFGPEETGLALSIERRVPELVTELNGRLAGATADERRRYLDRALDTLDGLARDAAEARGRLRARGDTELEVLHQYFDDVRRPDGR